MTTPMFPTTTNIWQFDAPAGQLEILTAPAKDNSNQATAIICHPHPQQEGTMHNKVVTTLAKAFQTCQIDTVRFNYRGVGKSEGQYGNGIGEQEDLMALVHWIQTIRPKAPLFLAGFSFGAAISAMCASRIPCNGLISIALPVQYDMLTTLSSIDFPWIMVQGDQDDVVDPNAVNKWVQERNDINEYILIPNVGHFFHGQLVPLRTLLVKKINAYLIFP